MIEAHPSVSDLQAIVVACERVDLHLRSLREPEDRTDEDSAQDPVDRENTAVAGEEVDGTEADFLLMHGQPTRFYRSGFGLRRPRRA